MLGADVLTFLAHRAIMFGDTRVPYQRRREAPGLLQRVEQRVHDGRRPRRLRSPRPKHESLQSEPSGYDEVAIRHRHSHLRDRLRDDSHEPLVRPRTGTRKRSTSDGNLHRRDSRPVGSGLVQSFRPPGSTAALAGICNERLNIGGLRPRPERTCAAVIDSADGRVILESVVAALARAGVTQVS